MCKTDGQDEGQGHERHHDLGEGGDARDPAEDDDRQHRGHAQADFAVFCGGADFVHLDGARALGDQCAGVAVVPAPGVGGGWGDGGC